MTNETKWTPGPTWKTCPKCGTTYAWHMPHSEKACAYVRRELPPMEEPIRTTQRPMPNGTAAYATRRLAGFSYLDSLAVWTARAASSKAEGR